MNHHAPIELATLTGIVDLLNPDPTTINVRAMSYGLANIIRWGGASELAIVVAQHSVIVLELFRQMFPESRDFRIYALLHDGHEYLFGDLTSPRERLLATLFPGFSTHVENLKNRFDIAIRQAPEFQLPEPSIEIRAKVHDADMAAADLEWRLGMPAANGPSPFERFRTRYPASCVRGLKALTPAQAEILFRETLVRELEERAWEVPR